MSASKSKKPQEKMLDHLLESIVIALGGDVHSHDRISLLNSWLEARGGKHA